MKQPAWRQAFDRLERAVGRPLEDAVASQRYVDAVALGLKVQLEVNRKVHQRVDRQVGAVLHLFNVPTLTDVRRLSQQLTTLTSDVRSVAAQTDLLVIAATAPDHDGSLNPTVMDPCEP
jgi:hypothetical protein